MELTPYGMDRRDSGRFGSSGYFLSAFFASASVIINYMRTPVRATTEGSNAIGSWAAARLATASIATTNASPATRIGESRWWCAESLRVVMALPRSPANAWTGPPARRPGLVGTYAGASGAGASPVKNFSEAELRQ